MTLNLGVRYELYTQPIDANNLGSLFNIKTGAVALPGKNGFSRAMVQGDHNNIGPRVGFAYQISQRFTAHAGAGVFYAMRDQNQSVTQFSGNTPNVPTVSMPSVSPTHTVTPPFTINTPIAVLPATTDLSSFTPAKPYGIQIKTQSLDNALMPMMIQYNFDLQYQATNNILLEAAYSGAHGRNLASSFIDENQIPFSEALLGNNTQANRPFPYMGSNILTVFSNATSTYNALNLKVQERLSHGLEVLANYTWQKNIDTANGTGPDAYTQNGGTSIAMDTYDLKLERGVDPMNIAQVLSSSASYILPFGQGQAFLNQILKSLFFWAGGW